MEMTCKELKRRAREAMGLPRPPFWAVALIYVLVDAGIELLSQLSSAFLAPVLGAFSAFLPILGGLFAVVFSFGYQLWCLWTARRQSPGPGALMQGFSISGRVLWMQVLIVLKLLLACFGWLFVLLLAASVFFPGGVMFLLSAPELTSSLLSYPMSLFIWALALRYALAPYLLADRPEDGAGAAVRRSAVMTPQVPSEAATSSISVRMYVPFEQVTARRPARCAASYSTSDSAAMWTGRAARSTSTPCRASL